MRTSLLSLEKARVGQKKKGEKMAKEAWSKVIEVKKNALGPLKSSFLIAAQLDN